MDQAPSTKKETTNINVAPQSAVLTKIAEVFKINLKLIKKERKRKI